MTTRVKKLKIVCPSCQGVLLYGNPINLDTDARVLLKDQSHSPITAIHLSVECFKCGLFIVFDIANKLQPGALGDSAESHFLII